MSLETFVEDFRRNDNIDEYRLKEKVEIYEKFVDRINDVIQTYDPEEYKHIESDPEDLKNMIKDLKYEIENMEGAIEEV